VFLSTERSRSPIFLFGQLMAPYLGAVVNTGISAKSQCKNKIVRTNFFFPFVSAEKKRAPIKRNQLRSKYFQAIYKLPNVFPVEHSSFQKKKKLLTGGQNIYSFGYTDNLGLYMFGSFLKKKKKSWFV
jgi:hypothetical protein